MFMALNILRDENNKGIWIKKFVSFDTEKVTKENTNLLL